MARSIDLLGRDVLKRVEDMHKQVERNRRQIVLAGARAAAVEQESQIASDSGGDSKLSGVGRRRGREGGARLGVTVRARGSGRSTHAIVKATGPLPLIDRDVPGHVIRSGYISGAYRTTRTGGQIFGPAAPALTGGRRAVLNIPGVGFRRSARHPGTRGKGTWNKGKRDGLPAADRVVEKETRESLTRVFRAGL